jgi:cyclophilin family peptidyl-prolyl cis-trans isomerase
VLARLIEKYPGSVRVIYRHFPLISIHDKAALATQGAEAAGLQDKFWEMHDLLFSRRGEWTGLTTEEFQEWLTQRAKDLDLDVERFKTDLTSQAIVSQAQQAYDENAARGMPGTPYLVINGEAYNGPLDASNLDAIVAMTQLQEKQFTDCPPITVDPNKQYLVTLHTEKGDITLELFADKAPLAVNSFLFLAKQGWFDGVTFHRVIPGFVAQAGDPSGTGYGGPGYAFDNETTGLAFDGPGMVGMANAGPGSNGSQFFIAYTSLPQLNQGYTIFGRVISGMDVAQKLTARDPSQSMDLPPGDKILSVSVVEK